MTLIIVAVITGDAAVQNPKAIVLLRCTRSKKSIKLYFTPCSIQDAKTIVHLSNAILRTGWKSINAVIISRVLYMMSN